MRPVRFPLRLFRTSSFRLTLLYAGLFALSVLVLFGVIYWSTAIYMARQLDDVVDTEIAELQDQARDDDPARLAAVVAALAARATVGEPRYLLQDSTGARRAGNLAPRAAVLGRFGFTLPADETATKRGHPFRARGVLLRNGDYLLVAEDAYAFAEMQELITRAFAWAGAITVVLAVLGGAIMSAGLLRRVETMSRATRAIMGGRLDERLPTRGTDDEFDHLAGSLNAMLDRVEGLMRGLRQVSNDIAHDLRTPLTRLRQRLELARRKARSPGDYEAAIDQTIADTDAILETFAALLRIAQIEAGTRKAGFRRVDLAELLQTVVEVYEPMAEERDQRLSAAIAPGLAIAGDRELLTQLFANLVENAIRHSPPGARVTVTARPSPTGVEVAIADDGPGIPAAQRASVFQRFYRLEASRTTPGSGLGLSLVAAIGALHGVTVELGDNAPGLRVSIRFPPAG